MLHVAQKPCEERLSEQKTNTAGQAHGTLNVFPVPQHASRTRHVLAHTPVPCAALAQWGLR